MSTQQIITILKNFRKASQKSKLRRDYFDMFEKRMVYRTTKSENPELELKLVKSILQKLSKTYGQKTR